MKRRVIAWTGGSKPAKYSEVSKDEKEFISKLFRDAVNTWRSNWQAFPPLELCRSFWLYARYDAHATFRD